LKFPIEKSSAPLTEMTKIQFHLFNLFLPLLHMLMFPMAHFVLPAAVQQNAPATPTEAQSAAVADSKWKQGQNSLFLHI
jgi:hypothetical protein